MNIITLPSLQHAGYHLASFPVRLSPLPCPFEKSLSPLQKKHLKEIRSAPAKKGLALIETYFSDEQHHAKLMNLKIYFYIQLKKIKKADALVIENYNNNKDNLLCLINYGDYLIRKKQNSAFEERFSPYYDLSYFTMRPPDSHRRRCSP